MHLVDVQLDSSSSGKGHGVRQISVFTNVIAVTRIVE